MCPSLTDTLCTRCGLCCDGSLFADVELAGAKESSACEVMGLEIEEGDGDARALLVQPCRALQGKRCGIYEYRPNCCRAFECRLLKDAQRGVVGLDLALDRIRETLKKVGRVRELAARLGQPDDCVSLKERCAEALTGSHGTAEPRVRRKRARLETEMAAVEELVRSLFLGEDFSRRQR